MKIRGKGKCSMFVTGECEDRFAGQQDLPACWRTYFFQTASWAKSTLLILCLALELGISRAEWWCANCSRFPLKSINFKKDHFRLC